MVGVGGPEEVGVEEAVTRAEDGGRMAGCG